MKIQATIATVLAIIAVALSGCSSTSARATQPNPTAEQTSATDTEEVQKYLSSKQRDDLYRHDFNVAATLIAHALEDGKFGPTERQGHDKLPLPSDYTGWGTLQTISRHDNADEQVKVWWNSDGSIDYSKGIQATSIRSAIDPQQSIHIATPRLEPTASNWQSALTGAALKGPTVTQPVTKAYVGDTETGLFTSFESTAQPTVADLKYWDETALQLLDTLMCEHFGEKWKSV